MSRRRNAAARIDETAPVFAALGEPTRLALVSRLCAEGPLSISRLSDRAPVTRQAITKHLETLEHAGIVRGTRAGRERIWQIETRRLELARQALDQISAQWDAAIDRLDLFLQRTGHG